METSIDAERQAVIDSIHQVVVDVLTKSIAAGVACTPKLTKKNPKTLLACSTKHTQPVHMR